MKLTQPLLLILLTALTTSSYSQSRPDAASLEAARKEQAAQQAAIAANAEKLDKAADAIIADLQAAVKDNAPAKAYDPFLQKISALSLTSGQRYSSNGKLETIRTFVTHWQDYRVALEQNKPEQALQVLRQLVQEAAVISIIPRSELIAQQDQLARQMQAEDQALVETLLKHFQATLATANTVADIQPFLQEVTTAQTTYARTHQNQGSAMPQVIWQLRNFATRWQDALNFAEAGNDANAQTALTNLFNDQSSFSEISVLIRPYRTRIVPKPRELPVQTVIYTAPTAPTAPEGPKPESVTVDNLDDLLAFFRRGPRMENQRMVSALDQMIRGRDALREHRQSTSILCSGDSGFSGVYADKLNLIRQRLLIQSIQTDLGSEVAPLPDELPLVYLRRIIQTAMAAGDWLTARNALDLQRGIPNAASPDELNLRNALEFMISGARSEVMGQYAAAQSTYQAALNNPSKLLPLKEVETRLRAIKDKLPKPATSTPAENEKASLLGDNRMNAFLFIGLIVGILGTLGVTHFRNR